MCNFNFKFQISNWAKINVIFITPSDQSFGLAPFEKNARNVDFSQRNNVLSNPIALFLLNFFCRNFKLISRIFCTYIFQNRLSATGVLSRSSSKNSAIRTVFYFSSYEEAAALLRHLTDDRLRGVLRWTAACCCGPRVVCGFKNSFYSVELRTACHKDSPLFSFFISEFLTRLFSKQQHIMNSSLSSLVLQF